MAVAALARGDLDGKLGVITRDLAIPLQLRDWNGIRQTPRRVSD
jgi:hypothetical protein